MTARKTMAVLTGFAGVGMVIGFAAITPSLIGISLAFMAAVMVAIVFVISVPALHLTSAPVVLFSNSVVASGVYGLCTIIAPAFDYYPSLPATTAGWTGLGAHVFIMIIGIGLLLAAIGRIGAVRATVVNNLEPLISAAAAAFLFSQFLSGFQFLGAGLILGAIIIIQTGKPPQEHS
ncbi:MAG: EamA family transporter [Rhodospirillales bacterium]|nr:EamA family transporter [Rhodospirillales bacterium]